MKVRTPKGTGVVEFVIRQWAGDATKRFFKTDPGFNRDLLDRRPDTFVGVSMDSHGGSLIEVFPAKDVHLNE